MNWTIIKFPVLVLTTAMFCTAVSSAQDEDNVISPSGPLHLIKAAASKFKLKPATTKEVDTATIEGEIAPTDGAIPTRFNSWTDPSPQRYDDDSVAPAFDPKSPAAENTITPTISSGSDNSILNCDSKQAESVLGQDFFSEPERRPGFAARLFSKKSNVNRIWGVGGVILTPNYDDSVALATSVAVPTNTLSTADANQDLGGLDFYLISRLASGKGWETRYFGLFSDDEVASLVGAATTSLTGLGSLSTTPGTVQSLYDLADATHSVTRSTEFHNFEINTLRRRKNCFFGRRVDMNESIYGFRYFSFDESINYSATRLLVGPVNPQVAYNSAVENEMYGFQLGRRIEKSLARRWGLASLCKVGIFNNRSRSLQAITNRDATGAIETAQIAVGADTGTAWNFNDRKDDVAFLGEFDLGLTYQFNQTTRARVGYKALGMTGIALSENQVPTDFTVANALQSVNADGDLFMQGAYFGIEFVR